MKDLMLPVGHRVYRVLVNTEFSFVPIGGRQDSARGLFLCAKDLPTKEGNSESSEGNDSLRKSQLVTAMEASYLRDLDHRSKFRRLNRSRLRRIIIQRRMHAHTPIVIEIRVESSK